MTKLFDRWLPGTTLLAWSSILLYFFFSGRIAAFLHPNFRPLVLIAGTVMLLLAVVFIFASDAPDCCSEDGCAHPMGRFTIGRVLTFVILLLPIGTAASLSPDAFGVSTILNRGVISDAQGLKAAPKALAKPVELPLPAKDGTQPQAETATNDYVPRTKDGNIAVQVIDLLYAAQDTSLRQDFEGKTVELIGQLMPDTVNNPTGKRFKVVRMFMVCCAADARPVAALIEVDRKPAAPEMSWVRVVGKPTFPVEGGRTIAVMKADSVTVVDPPEETMLY